ncbi:MAG: tyrosine-type recombinase/integrase [Pseudonocardiaceae bacterium]
MSFISRTPAGTYRAFWRDPAGRQRSKNFDTKRQAKVFLTELQSHMVKGNYADPNAGRTLFGDHARQWMATWNAEPTTVARDRSIMRNHVLPRWEAVPVAKIHHIGLQAWITDLGTRRSPATVAEAYRLASGVLRSAVRNRLLITNPAEGIRLPRRRRQDTHNRVISQEEVLTKLWPAAPERYRAIIATAAGTGLRWGEAAGLCLDAMDLAAARLHVIRTVIEVSGHTSFKPYPKSAAGRRTIPLPSWLIGIITHHLVMYSPGVEQLAYPNTVGMPLRRTLFRTRVWKPTLLRSGLDPTLRFHDLRHSYATSPQMSRIASAASFGSLCEHRLPGVAGHGPSCE